MLVVGHKGLIGSAFSNYLISRNKSIIGIDLNSERKHRSEDKSKLLEFNFDISNEKQVKRFSKELKKLSIEISGIINFSAINPKYNELNHGYNLKSQKNASIIRALESGTLGIFSLIKEIDTSLTSNCSIVLIGSDLSVGAPNQKLYCKCSKGRVNHDDKCKVKPLFYSIDKFATIALTKYLATFFAAGKRKIRVNCVCLGPVDNGMELDFKNRLTETLPMNRLGKPSDFNETFEFMLYHSSPFQTGSIIMVDGGKTII